MHFHYSGKDEGRRGVPSVQRLSFAPLNDARRPVLVICHEASRTGAPILGWNSRSRFAEEPSDCHPAHAGRRLGKGFRSRERCRRRSLNLRGMAACRSRGARGASRTKLSTSLCCRKQHSDQPDGSAARRSWSSVPSRSCTNSLPIPVLLAGCARSSIGRRMSSFPRKSWRIRPLKASRRLMQRRGIHVLAQGRQLLPAAKHPKHRRRTRYRRDHAIGRMRKTSLSFWRRLVGLRKGVDFFLSVAAAARRLAPNVSFKFIWVGDGYKPEKTQIIQSIFGSRSTRRIWKSCCFPRTGRGFRASLLGRRCFLCPRALRPATQCRDRRGDTGASDGLFCWRLWDRRNPGQRSGNAIAGRAPSRRGGRGPRDLPACE